MDESKNTKISDLCDDIEFRKTVQEFEARIQNLGNIINECCHSEISNKQSIEEKVKHDLFLSYSLSSLYWMYLRTQGENSSDHVKSELDRIKKYMDKSKQIHDRKSMPKLDKAAAGRFVRSGLWDPSQQNPAASRKRKHTTFDEDD